MLYTRHSLQLQLSLTRQAQVVQCSARLENVGGICHLMGVQCCRFDLLNNFTTLDDA